MRYLDLPGDACLFCAAARRGRALILSPGALMTEGRQTRDIDQAALILALLVAGWQIADQSGPWGVVNTPIGLVLLLVIGAYSNPTLDRKFLRIYLQVAAVAVGAMPLN
jgi:hypothetical protein